MRLKIVVLLILSGSFSKVYAQKADSDTLIDRMKSAITSFFITKGALKKDEVGTSLNFVFATELRTHGALGYDHFGIYRIAVFQSHSDEHILIKENSKFGIFDIKQIHETLKEIINYSTRNKICVDSMFVYVKEAVGMYDMNYKIMPHTAGKIPVK